MNDCDVSTVELFNVLPGCVDDEGVDTVVGGVLFASEASCDEDGFNVDCFFMVKC